MKLNLRKNKKVKLHRFKVDRRSNEVSGLKGQKCTVYSGYQMNLYTTSNGGRGSLWMRPKARGEGKLGGRGDWDIWVSTTN